MLALARQSDALVENFKVGGLAKYGLDYPRVAAINPRLVYASITGFGQDGPYADRAGYDFIIQGMSGFMSVTGERDDVPGGGPQKAGVAITDLMTGMYTSVALLAALAHRDRTGQGQWIDACLFDSSVAMMAVMNMNYLVSGAAPRRAGNAHQNIVPYQVFACADGHVIVAVGNDGQFRKFCEIAGRREWAGGRPIRNQCCARAQSRHARADDRRGDAHAHAARMARGAGARPAFPAVRSIGSTRCLRDPQLPGTRDEARSSAPACRHRAAGARAVAPVAAARCRMLRRRRCSASTRRTCCASASDLTMRGSTISRRAASIGVARNARPPARRFPPARTTA